MSPFYVGAQKPLPKGKRGRCVLSESMLTEEEKKVLHSGVPLHQQVDRFGFFVFETWECPVCHGNIYALDKRNIARHRLLHWSLTGQSGRIRIQSGAYITPTKTTSGKRFKRSQFMTHQDILRLVDE